MFTNLIFNKHIKESPLYKFFRGVKHIMTRHWFMIVNVYLIIKDRSTGKGETT